MTTGTRDRFVCPVPDCRQVIRSRSGFGAHVYHKHPELKGRITADVVQSATPTEIQPTPQMMPHDYPILEPAKRFPGRLVIGLVPVLLAGALFGMVPLTVIAGMLLLVVPALLGGWYWAARGMVAEVLVLREIEGRAIWAWEWWPRATVEGLPDDCKYRYSGRWLPVVTAQDPSTFYAFQPYRDKAPDVPSEEIGLAFDQSDTRTLGESLMRMSRRDVVKVSAMALVLAMSMAGNIFLVMVATPD